MRILFLLLALLATSVTLAHADDWDEDRVVHNRRAAAADAARESEPADPEDAADDDGEPAQDDTESDDAEASDGERPLGSYFGTGDEFRLSGVGTSRRDRRHKPATPHDGKSTDPAPRSAVFAPRHRPDAESSETPESAEQGAPDPDEPSTSEPDTLAATPGFSVVDMNDATHLDDDSTDSAPLALLPTEAPAESERTGFIPDAPTERPIADELAAAAELAAGEPIYPESAPAEPAEDESKELAAGEMRAALDEYSELFTDSEPDVPVTADNAPLLDLSAEFAAAAPDPAFVAPESALTLSEAVETPAEQQDHDATSEMAASDAVAPEATDVDSPASGVIATPVRAPAAPAPSEGLERLSSYPAMQGLRKGKPRRGAEQSAEQRNRAEAEAERDAATAATEPGADPDADTADPVADPQVNRDDPDEW